MWKIIWPLILIVTSNTMYNICTKSTPSNANAFGSLLITYITAAAITAVFFFYNTDIANTTLELSKFNWASIALGICIVGLELGYIFLYRAGANVSSASLIANICLAIALVIVGVIMYKEHVTSQQLIGIVVCIIGIILITK